MGPLAIIKQQVLTSLNPYSNGRYSMGAWLEKQGEQKPAS